jgi:hypothetical protein
LLSLVAVSGLMLVLLLELSGLNRMRANPRSGQDYFPAVEYVAARRLPGEPVLVAWPPPAYLALGSREDLIFVSGTLDRARARIYAQRAQNGEYLDYWIGVPSIVTTGQLCQKLLISPNLWLIVDRARLRADWAYEGEMADVMLGMTYNVDPDWVPGNAMVRRPAFAPDRDPQAEQLCIRAMEEEGLRVPE